MSEDRVSEERSASQGPFETLLSSLPDLSGLGVPQFPKVSELVALAGWADHPGGEAEPMTELVLRCREQALYAAALITECTPFPEDDSEKVVSMAKRFEQYLSGGQ